MFSSSSLYDNHTLGIRARAFKYSNHWGHSPGQFGDKKTDLPLPCMFLFGFSGNTLGEVVCIYKRTKNCTPWKHKKWILKPRMMLWNMQVLLKWRFPISSHQKVQGCKSSFLCQFYYVCWVEQSIAWNYIPLPNGHWVQWPLQRLLVTSPTRESRGHGLNHLVLVDVFTFFVLTHLSWWKKHLHDRLILAKICRKLLPSFCCTHYRVSTMLSAWSNKALC